jgi:recombination protein RecR
MIVGSNSFNSRYAPIFAAMELPSKLLERTVSYFESLPGVGRRTALRYTLELLKMNQEEAQRFGQSITQLVNELGFCTICHNVSDDEVCQICAHPKRDKGTICVVEDLRDLLAIESTGQYYGVYHVLGGVISPLDGVGPADLHIETLLTRTENAECKEIIFALPATMEGDTTNFYLYKRLLDKPVKVTSLARGVAIGNELQYTDELTLGRSIQGRLPYENSMRNS